MQDATQERISVFNRIYARCRRLVPDAVWRKLVDRTPSPETFPDILHDPAPGIEFPEYLAELAHMEYHVYTLRTGAIPVPEYAEKLSINPTLKLFENTWQNLASQIEAKEAAPEPEKGVEQVIVWQHPVNRESRAKPAAEEDFLVLKMALEELSVQEVARQGGVPGAVIVSALVRALQDGTVLGPEPGIKRNLGRRSYENIDPRFFTARIFSLQWHITQACDLHCRHCYDRQQYASLSRRQESRVLDDMAEFCASHNVHGQVTFTGGNPLLHPDFENLYRQAAERGFTTAILGNPTTGEQLLRIRAIQPPAFYQVSLEGLEEHNDYMRGAGHFRKVLSFLDLLREHDIYSMVMLTLTRANMDQVLPLAEILRRKTDLFTFNRLSMVGEGANLVAADIDAYETFLEQYAAAAAANPCLGQKDNLLNLLYHGQERPLFGGCTGFGCGAAFNFITLLADGEVHACRKFPSPLGNIRRASLHDIYHSQTAERYREGSAACRDCPIRPVCGGCLAVAHSHGRDIFRQRDPYCFLDSKN